MTESEFLDDERKAPTPPGCCKSSRGRDRLPKLEPRTPTTQGGRLLKAQSPGTAPRRVGRAAGALSKLRGVSSVPTGRGTAEVTSPSGLAQRLRECEPRLLLAALRLLPRLHPETCSEAVLRGPHRAGSPALGLPVRVAQGQAEDASDEDPGGGRVPRAPMPRGPVFCASSLVRTSATRRTLPFGPPGPPSGAAPPLLLDAGNLSIPVSPAHTSTETLCKQLPGGLTDPPRRSVRSLQRGPSGTSVPIASSCLAGPVRAPTHTLPVHAHSPALGLPSTHFHSRLTRRKSVFSTA